jgi:hypothetical protein
MWSRLAVCASLGQVDHVRTLLKAGHNPMKPLDRGRTAAHALLDGPPVGRADARDVARCLEILVEEGRGRRRGARRARDVAPIHRLALHARDMALLENASPKLKGAWVRLGCDQQAWKDGPVPRLSAPGRRPARHPPAGGERHGTPDLQDQNGVPPLVYAFWNWRYGCGKAGVMELLRLSSRGTRRFSANGEGVLDLIAQWEREGSGGSAPGRGKWHDWERALVTEVLASNAPRQAREPAVCAAGRESACGSGAGAAAAAEAGGRRW